MNQVTLSKVTVYEGIEAGEMVDLAEEESETSFISPEPFIGITTLLER